MKLKITIMSPTHIATGDKIPTYCYYEKNNRVRKVNMEDIIRSKQIPAKDLMKLQFTNSSDNSKRYICDFFDRRLKYHLLPTAYELEGNLDGYLDIAEQIKSLNKPYIPGSSLKGAILNAIVYYLLETNREKIKYFIDKREINEKYFEKDLFKFLFGEKYEDIFKIFSSCLIVRDIYFDRMQLCSSERLNMKGSEEGSSFNSIECIAAGQVVIDDYIEVNENEKDILKREIGKVENKDLQKQYKILLSMLSTDNLFIVLRRFFRPMISDDLEYFQNRVTHESQADIQQFIKKLDLDDKTGAYLKIGNSTNYFFKSISMFFKKNHPDFYQNHFQLFAPVKLHAEGRPVPKPELMPNTRTIFWDDEKYYLPGVIHVQKCD